MRNIQPEQKSRKGMLAGICALATCSFAGLLRTPQVEHFGGIFLDSVKYSFSSRPPAFESINSFASSLRVSNSHAGFGEIVELKAVCYHPVSKMPLSVENYTLPKIFSIEGNLVGVGKTEKGEYYFDIGDDKKPIVRISASSDLLPEWNPLSPGGHRALLTFKQGSDSVKQSDVVTVTTASGNFCMVLDSAQFKY